MASNYSEYSTETLLATYEMLAKFQPNSTEMTKVTVALLDRGVTPTAA